MRIFELKEFAGRAANAASSGLAFAFRGTLDAGNGKFGR